MRVEEVSGGRALREFVCFPQRLYRGDPQWAPPLWIEERGAYNRSRNPILAHSDYVLLAVRDGGSMAGRALAYVDHAFNDYYHSRIGFFGAFECLDEPQAAEALLDRAESWLRERGMSAIRGPIHPVAESWGFCTSGYGSSPVFMAPYNPPYYNRFMELLGYAKVKDLLAYEADARQGYRIPERFVRFQEKTLSQRPGLSLRRLNLARLKEDAEHIWRISNIALRNNWGYVPLNRDELIDMIRKLKAIVDVDAVWFVEDAGAPVGYALGFPDLNVVLKKIGGRLFPLGFLTLLLEIRKVRDYRLFGLAVLPEYHNLGLDVLLYMSLFQSLAPKGIRLEANYILEDNLKIRNALEKLKLAVCKTYRVYEKSLI